MTTLVNLKVTFTATVPCMDSTLNNVLQVRQIKQSLKSEESIDSIILIESVKIISLKPI